MLTLTSALFEETVMKRKVDRIVVHLEPEEKSLSLRCRRNQEGSEVSYRVPNLPHAIRGVFQWLKTLGELSIFLHPGPGEYEAERQLASLGLQFQKA
jgi:hypothetical protein